MNLEKHTCTCTYILLYIASNFQCIHAHWLFILFWPYVTKVKIQIVCIFIVRYYRPWSVLLHHRNAERFARNWTLRGRNETLWERNETFWGRNETFRERNALHFWESNALYALASFSISPDIRISSHGESAVCLSSLRKIRISFI